MSLPFLSGSCQCPQPQLVSKAVTQAVLSIRLAVLPSQDQHDCDLLCCAHFASLPRSLLTVYSRERRQLSIRMEHGARGLHFQQSDNASHTCGVLSLE